MTITKGQLTFDAEGQEGGLYHSRVLHVPSSSSGLTIGRGYDMKEKTAAKISSDLTAAGIEHASAGLLSKAAGLSGDDAKQFITDNNLQSFEITPETQEALFDAIYSELENDVKRICNKADCVATYGAVNWDGLRVEIKDTLVDLRFRGDYHATSRRLIQKHVANNDVKAFSSALSDQSQWTNVPPDRFNRRVDFLTGSVDTAESKA
ncbi:MAG: hypothetical protein V3T17_06605 [Pseudomonadales bacterium]